MKIVTKNTLLLGASIGVPFFIITGFIIKYGVNVPVTDQYALIPLFQKLDHGTLAIGDFWTQHNEHRVFFPNLILVALAQITNWNIRAEIALSLIFSLLSFILIVLLIKNTVLKGYASYLLIFVLGLFFFSPVQWQNWLWGWQFEWFLCILASISCFYLMSKIDPKKQFSLATAAAVLAAIIASYSLASGIFIWIAGLLYLIIIRVPYKNLVVWCASALLTIALYFHGYVSPGRQGPIEAAFEHPVDFIRYFFAYVGRPIADEPYAAILAGVFMVAVFLAVIYVLYRTKRIQSYAIWISVIIYALLAGAATSSSRIDLGIINALSSRYTSFSLLILISLSVIMWDIFTRYIRYKKFALSKIEITASACLIMAPFVFSTYYNGQLGMQKQSLAFRYIKQCTHEINPTDACLYEAYFTNRDDALDRVNYLKHKHWGGY